MTRENKLALVVGFALILFVGILISDHFSTARSQGTANLARPSSNQPVIQRTSNIIDLQPRTDFQQPTALMNTATMAAVDSARPEQRTTINPDDAIYMGADVRPISTPEQQIVSAPSIHGFTPVTPEPPAQQVRVVYHDVRGGETLFAICRDHYGDTSLVHALARFNNMDNPAQIRAGRRLRMPPAEELGGRTSTTPSAQVVSAPPTSLPVSQPKTYTVKSGDSLAQIARRFLGSKSKWKKLHDMNRDVLNDPHDLKVGMVIKVG